MIGVSLRSNCRAVDTLVIWNSRALRRIHLLILTRWQFQRQQQKPRCQSLYNFKCPTERSFLEQESEAAVTSRYGGTDPIPGDNVNR
jgi:hypothetical protein